MKNLVAIVGRPNVGKSTIFNRLTGSRDSITDDKFGTTRDRNFGNAQWNGVNFVVIDTGGYIENEEGLLSKKINEQIFAALKEASVIIFVVDAKVGVHPLDQDFLKNLNSLNKKIITVVNKVDNYNLALAVGDFYKLGIKEFFPISAVNGSGTGELLDKLVANLDKKIEEIESSIPRIAIVGKPNVGKSTFINTILGEERVITSSVAGTTRDSVDSIYNLYGHKFIFTDTAGLRKKNKKKEDVEFYSTMRAISSIESSDICIVMLDAEKGIEIQDINIISLAYSKKKGILIIVNKWDLVEKDNNTLNEYKKHILERIKPIKGIPIIFCSSIIKQRIFAAIDEIKNIHSRMGKRLSTSKLNDILLPIVKTYPPKSIRGKEIIPSESTLISR